ncbi:hydantoinase B/oxoprolinase family protein, partial [Candidatus Bathyarchaeota archaeon]|nr:hydantoinase B/oxoprolinase family protein [Candidatus Bathyarchaeota archaeon]
MGGLRRCFRCDAVEEGCIVKVDATTVEVIKGALIYAAEEMGIALRKSAYSPNIKERMDHSCALFDRERRLIAQAAHIP